MTNFNITFDDLYTAFEGSFEPSKVWVITHLPISFDTIQEEYEKDLLTICDKYGLKDDFMLYALSDLIEENDSFAIDIFDYMVDNSILKVDNNIPDLQDIIDNLIDTFYCDYLEQQEEARYELEDLNYWWYSTR